jgi:hypothetical protein
MNVIEKRGLALLLFVIALGTAKHYEDVFLLVSGACGFILLFCGELLGRKLTEDDESQKEE